MGDGTPSEVEDDAELSPLARGPFGRWEPPDTDVILGSHAQGAVPDFPLWPEPDGDIAPLGWDEGGDGGETGPARDFAGIEGPAEPPGVNPCAEEEAACAEGLEAAGMSDTHWCDCVKGWDGKCVCLVYALNDDTGDEDDGDGGEGGGDQGPHDPPDWRAGLIVPPTLPILRIPPRVAPIEIPVVPPWVLPIVVRGDEFPDLDRTGEGLDPDLDFDDDRPGARRITCRARGFIRNCPEADGPFEAGASGVNCQKCCAAANDQVRHLVPLPAGCDWGHFQCTCPA